MSHQKTDAYYRTLAEDEEAKDRRFEHARRVLAHQEDSRWLGTHSRPEPDHNGWTEFEVYRRRNPHSGVVTFHWSAVCNDSPVGFDHGPFGTAKEAHDDAA
jgi:hypothetical protein